MRSSVSSEAIKKCQHILSQLRKSPNAEPFNRPPDPNHPYYTELINDHLDFNTIERNLKDGYYSSTFAFIDDVRKLFKKAFSNSTSEIYSKALELSNMFEALSKEFENIPLKDSSSSGGYNVDSQ